MPSSRLLLALAIVAATGVHACTLPDYVYDDDAFNRLNEGGAAGSSGGVGGGGGLAGGPGGAGSPAGHAGSAGLAGSSGSSGHSGAGTSAAGASAGESGAAGEAGQEHGGDAGAAGEAGVSGSSGHAGEAGTGVAGMSAGGAGAGTSGSAGKSGAGAGGAGGSGAGTAGSAGSSGTAGKAGAGGTAGSAGASGTAGTAGAGGKSGAGGTSGAAGASGAAGTGGATSCTVKHYDFTGCNDGFTTPVGKKPWQCGKPTVGPSADHTSGSGSLWATRLGEKPQYCEDSTLQSPVLDLSPHAGKPLKLSFWSWNAFRACDPNGDFGAGICKLECGLVKDSYSGGALEVLVNGTWTVVAPTGGYGTSGGQSLYVNGSTQDSDGNPKAPCQMSSLDNQKVFGSSGPSQQWKQWTFDVSAYVSASFQFRLHFASAPNEDFCFPNTSGWFIDDLDLGYAAPCP